ncbi:MAG: dTMP kinase [Patescibacteria group bacterium]|nr:dTMP kinase [Patescibacteria group bacterium]
MKGKLIVIEGVDGSGKSTQVKMFPADYKLAFPRYDHFFGKIIKIILHHEWGKRLSPYLTAGFFALDRLMAKSMINSWLKEGQTVLVDRYTASSQAHQGAKLKGEKRQKLINWIGWLENKLFKLPLPDKVIYLKVPAEMSQRLMVGRKQKDTVEKDLVYQKETVKVYEKLAKRFNFMVIDCMMGNKLLSKHAINRKIKRAFN